jgi:hypothetical protein
MSWILIGGLYLLGIGFFRLLGGLPAAGDAFKQWARSTTRSSARVSSGS